MSDIKQSRLTEIETFLVPSNQSRIKNLSNDNIRFLLDDLQPRLDIVLNRLEQRGVRVILTVPTKAKKKVKHVAYERFRHGWEIVDLFYAEPSNNGIYFANLECYASRIFNKLSKSEEQQELDF
ncbi:hypothetical protein ACEWAB_10185 [Vibrio parahaemolyticus]|uniref:hypothetical protein n=1 Tax=Vibrio parahaemolyticus TaxID=670 RepID=UPI000464ED2F|nr:hypothetical protein [Vibrio parahaemolyticus]MBE4803294.1 hypothetical protein [Vibrio parahaemolyticus]TOO77984.1 hypothetical protein CGH28_18475 [Vibrio parahaemolyticus]HCH3750665.1 hypothetical protein [Vibrio parahaemolyticus]HCH4148693.1 hypothetical protein [Vibrio parahaemolyticus]